MKKILFTRRTSPNLIQVINEFKKEKYKNIYEVDVFDEVIGNKLSHEEIAEYDLIITDNNISNCVEGKFKKRDGQILIQVTHGIWIKKPSNHIVKNTDETDFILCPNEFSIERFLNVGYKRDDLILSALPRINYYKEKLSIINEQSFSKKDFGIPDDKKIVLFAPSWVSKSATLGRIKYKLDTIIKSMNDDEHLVVVPHPLSIKKMKTKYVSVNKNKDRFTLVNKIVNNEDGIRMTGDMLMLIADRMITDYSSIVFDYISIFKDRRAEFYFPDKDLKQSFRTRFGYRMQYLFWGQGTEFNRNITIVPNKFRMFEQDGVEALISKINNLLS